MDIFFKQDDAAERKKTDEATADDEPTPEEEVAAEEQTKEEDQEKAEGESEVIFLFSLIWFNGTK